MVGLDAPSLTLFRQRVDPYLNKGLYGPPTCEGNLWDTSSDPAVTRIIFIRSHHDWHRKKQFSKIKTSKRLFRAVRKLHPSHFLSHKVGMTIWVRDSAMPRHRFSHKMLKRPNICYIFGEQGFKPQNPSVKIN